MLGTIAMLGADLSDLIEDQSEWSQKTFGSDADRGPVGAMRHLAKEAAEAERAWQDHAANGGGRVGLTQTHQAMQVRHELADCLLLILDASRRAGLKPLDLVHEAQAKMRVNKARQWPKPEADTPVEHVRASATDTTPDARDCYHRAEPGEPRFTLLGRDRHAPALVWLWAVLRELDGEAKATTADARNKSVAMMVYATERGRPVTGVGVGVLAGVLAGVLEMIRVCNTVVAKTATNQPTDADMLRAFLCAAKPPAEEAVADKRREQTAEALFETNLLVAMLRLWHQHGDRVSLDATKEQGAKVAGLLEPLRPLFCEVP